MIVLQNSEYHTFTMKVTQENILLYKAEWAKWRIQDNYALITCEYEKDLIMITFDELYKLIYDEMSGESRFWKIVGMLITT